VNTRRWIGLTPTEADLARDLMRAAEHAVDIDWHYDAADSSLRGGTRQ